MWKSWKEKIIDFFYDEIEVEDSSTSETEQANKSFKKTKDVFVPSRPSAAKRTIDSKITYQYPKHKAAPFHVPANSNPRSAVKKRNHNASREAVQQQLQEKHASVRARTEKTAISRPRKRLDHKEIENTPAFIRRKWEQKHRSPQKRSEPIEQKEEVQLEKKPDKSASMTDLTGIEPSRPEELDAVFRKKDKKIPEEQTEENKTKIRDFEESSTIETKTEVKAKEERKSTEVDSAYEKDTSTTRSDASEISYDDLQAYKEADPVFVEKPREIIAEPASTTGMKEQGNSSVENQVPEQSDQVIQQPAVPNHLLNDPSLPEEDDADWLIEQQILLEDTLEHFHIQATVEKVTQGPSVTRFEIQPALGVKVNKIRNLQDDLKLNLAAKDIRIEAPIPGKHTVGIEVPNQYPQKVTLQQLIETNHFQEANSPLTVALGLSIEGDPIFTNIGDMPHGLIAGATGSGKSVCINSIILSLLYKADYRETKLLLIDPKMVELTPYNGIPHLLSPVITDAKAATAALKWAVEEMEERYERFVASGVRNIQKFNEKMEQQGNSADKMAYIVIIIDELADLMMISPQEVEDAISRIAQKARACGIHLLLATQRPSVDVITGLIKANIPTRIAFSVSSQVDSRTILDTGGAEKLLGRGDMLFIENGATKSLRLQGPFVSDEEIDRVATYVKSIAEPHYLFEQEQLLLEADQEDAEDELLTEVLYFVAERQQASTSLLQRRFRIGYNRAARLIDALEDKGIISGQNGSKPREVLVTKEQIES